MRPDIPDRNGAWSFQVNTWDDLAAATAAAQQAGAIGTAHLFRARMADRITLLPLLPETSVGKFKLFARHSGRRPAVLLIGDDDGLDRGPRGWGLSERAVRWSAACLIHAAGAELAHYEAAIQAAETVGRMLLIECSTGTADAWVQLVRSAPNRPSSLLIRPNTGPHPLPMDKGQMQ